MKTKSGNKSSEKFDMVEHRLTRFPESANVHYLCANFSTLRKAKMFILI
jgi:hypothetical protein